MQKRVVPMLHVPDVGAAVEWYQQIGFSVNQTYGDDGDGYSFAILSFGTSEVMFNEGGTASTSRRREVDLYVYTDDLDHLHTELKDKVDVIEEPHDTFYGMREFIFRDLNGFWITFGEHSTFARLMYGVQEDDIEFVRKVLASSIVKRETLNAALAMAAQKQSKELTDLLISAGAEFAPHVDVTKLSSYIGCYEKDDFQVNVTFENDRLFAAAGKQERLTLIAVNETTFRPVEFDDFGTITFLIDDGKVTGCVLRANSELFELKRIEDGATL